MITIPPVLERLAYRYPSVLVDAVTRHEPALEVPGVLDDCRIAGQHDVAEKRYL